jgi:hypothetical protein
MDISNVTPVHRIRLENIEEGLVKWTRRLKNLEVREGAFDVGFNGIQPTLLSFLICRKLGSSLDSSL